MINLKLQVILNLLQYFPTDRTLQNPYLWEQVIGHILLPLKSTLITKLVSGYFLFVDN